MTEHHASQRLMSLYATLQVVYAKEKPLPVEAFPPLLKAVLTAAHLTQELEEELAIAERQLANRHYRRGPADIDQEGNVVRLSFRPRIIRTVNPSGGDAA